jgi:hypothetical protein
MATKRFAQGAKFRVEIATVLTAIPKVQDISLPTNRTEQLDVTDHDSPNGRREYIGGLIDSAELTITVGWDPGDTVHSYLETNVGNVETFQIELVDTGGSHGTQYDFDALIVDFMGKAPVNGQHTADIVIKPSGSVTKTAAA